MQFNDYHACRNKLIRYAKMPDNERRALQRISKSDYRKIASEAPGVAGEVAKLETEWVERGRPFYNIWPVVIDLAARVRLDLPFAQVRPSLRTDDEARATDLVLLRFARGHEPDNFATVLFINRRGDRLKALWRDQDGLALFYKRLESGTFEMLRPAEESSTVELDAAEPAMLFSGVSIGSDTLQCFTLEPAFLYLPPYKFVIIR